MKTQFKVLVYQGEYVDASMLFKGLYATGKPRLYNEYTTIESLLESLTAIVDPKDYKDYYINLQQCELKTVNLTFQEVKLDQEEFERKIHQTLDDAFDKAIAKMPAIFCCPNKLLLP